MAENSQNIQVQVKFSFNGLDDALYFSLDEWPTITQDQIDALIQQRWNDWNYAITHPASDPDLE